MNVLRVLTAAEQVADFLKQELRRGEWGAKIPGGNQLARLLGVGRNTVEAALRILEAEGVLVPQGAGRRRRVISPGDLKMPPALRVALFSTDPADIRLDYLESLQHQLNKAGHIAIFVGKFFKGHGLNERRIATIVKQTKADAWVVVGGSRAVLEWFLAQGIPTFALFGRRRDLNIAGAGPDKSEAYRRVVRRLVSLGHRRIILLALAARRSPQPGLPERAFLTELEAQGISTGSFHLPDWEESPAGLQRLLDSLFEVTPPTAFLIDEAYLFHAVKHHLNTKGFRIPDDVSLVCTDPDRTFEWCRPSIAHIQWDSTATVRRALRWVEHVANGRPDIQQIQTSADFVDGGTVGPPPDRYDSRHSLFE